MSTRKATGQEAEAVAARYLQRRGIRICDRNVFSRGGEIDLVGMDGDTVVFFEVRYRGHGSLAGAAESVSYRKQQRVLRAASYYLHRHGLWNAPARVDVVAVAPGGLRRYKIQWIKNAIQSSA
ncbi:MAG: YraN family protein [Marinobacter sp.]|uniref:YraN family protein n=1 Tax=Marinobacter sp. TaxID=50741 RepID=UPI00299DB479|nr:YraN family protein [Marinobacter sp.]MDX1757866.1 YraN family protein [Marinobacter sp.]